MLIQCDVDNVLADFTGGCLRVMRGMGYNFAHDDVTEWDIDSLLPEEQRAEFWRRVHLPGFCYCLKALPGALDAVKALRALGSHEVRFLTSAMPNHATWKPERTAWLIGHLGEHDDVGERQLSIDAVTFTHDKAAYPGDVLVDDKPAHVEAWLATGRPAILVDQPYNRGVSLLAPRAKDVMHAAELILARAR